MSDELWVWYSEGFEWAVREKKKTPYSGSFLKYLEASSCVSAVKAATLELADNIKALVKLWI